MNLNGESPVTPTPPSVESEEKIEAEENEPNPPPERETATPVEESGAKEAERLNFGDQPPQSDSDLLPVVGLGGSAGSIPALQEFFGRIPTNLGIAYVVVVHLPADYESQLGPILQTRTKMPVTQVKEPVMVEPDHVYVIPPAFHLAMNNGAIHLTVPDQEFGKRVAVDLFFRTLAVTHRSKAMAVVLSGLDGDGAIGIKRVKEHGGVTVVQDPDEAEHDGMPRAAIETGMVDWILGIEPMVAKIIEWIHNEQRIQLPPAEIAGKNGPPDAITGANDDEIALREVLAFLHTRTGHNFAHYKRATVLRRIMRRLQVNSLGNLPDYAIFLRTHPGEAGALLQDLLISVTNFFRDPDAFSSVATFIRRLFHDRNPRDTVRVWVPGCATGEEAYSLAMLLAEHAETLDSPPEVQIFASDLDEQALRFAREGIYPATIAADVSPERLRRFFVFDQGHYRVKKEMRERILFTHHNLLRDAPFSRLDMISCRNLLIYFNREAQERVFEVFYFALKAGGLLFLGGSETTDDSEKFHLQEKKARIFQRQNRGRSQVALPSLRVPSALQITDVVHRAHSLPALPRAMPSEPQLSISYSELHLKLLEHWAPPSILVNSNYDIVHLSEHAGQFLRFAGGQVSTNLLSVLHPALRLELRTALYRAVQNREDVDVFPSLVEMDGVPRRIGARVRPLGAGERSEAVPFLLIMFDEQPVNTHEGETSPASHASALVVQTLETEVQQLRTNLRLAVEQYEASAEELKASNEELQAMNEEQHSTAEELETSREEIQAANEELVTVNQELKSKLDDLSRINADLQNLMASTDIATVFLNRELRIKRYTPRAVEIFNLIPSDFGRPLSDLRDHFTDENFAADAAQVLRTLTPIERQVTTTQGHWYSLRVTPYRTLDDRIDGVVLAFVDTTQSRSAELALRESEDRYRTVFNSMGDAFALCQIIEDDDGAVDAHILEVNSTFESMTGRAAHQHVGATLRELTPELEQWWRQVGVGVAKQGEAVTFDQYAPSSNRWFDIYSYPVGEKGSGRFAMLFRDITERKRAEEAQRESEERLHVIFNQATAGITLTDLEGNFTEVNDQFCVLTGYSRQELLLLRMQDITHKDDLPIVLEQFQLLVKQGTPFDIEKRYVRKDGQLVWVMASVSPVRSASGQPQSCCSIIVDIDERKLAEEARRESEEQRRIAVEGGNLGTCDWYYPERLLYWNDRHFHLLGMEPREVVYWSEMMARIHPDDIDRVREDFRIGVEEVGHFELEYRIVRDNDGAIRWLSRVGRVVARDSKGLPRRVGSVISDVTERRENREALKRANDELESRVEERTRDLEEALRLIRAEAHERENAEAARGDLLRRLVNSQEEERRRISRELHDSLGQHLTAVGLGLKRLQDKWDAEGDGQKEERDHDLDKLRVLVDNLMIAAHRQARELRPAELDDMGLEVALRHYVNDWGERTSVDADFQTVGFENRRLPPDLETTFYRVVQEALTNVARHAHASLVSVVLRMDSMASAIIEDDGVGFEPEEVQGRLGLLGMRERLALVGGTLDIESSSEGGTTLFARVPLPKISEAPPAAGAPSETG